MNKKDFITAVNYAKYLAFILATVAVLVFQFLGESICITLALSLYVVAFGLMFATSVVQCVEIYNADKMVKQNHLKELNPQINEEGTITINSDGKKEEVEVVKLKKEKALSVLTAIFFGVFTLFTFAVLILY